MDTYLILIFLIFIIFLFFLLRPKNTCKISYNPELPGRGYKLVYTDEKAHKKLKGVDYGTILYSKKYDISGKPDYIYKKYNEYLPVELKSAVNKEKFPREKDLMQLAFYFLLIEDIYSRPKKGIIIYSNVMFTIKNTRKLRRKIKSVLKDMRFMLKTGEQEANSSFANCKYCFYREVCEYV